MPSTTRRGARGPKNEVLGARLAVVHDAPHAGKHRAHDHHQRAEEVHPGAHAIPTVRLSPPPKVDCKVELALAPSEAVFEPLVARIEGRFDRS